MWYDQGQLVNAYLDTFSITKDIFYSSVAHDILDFLRRDMIGAEGEVFSAVDADSVEHEGASRKKEAAPPLSFSIGPQCDQPNNMGAGTKGVANKARRERKRPTTDSERGIIINLTHSQAQAVMENNEQDRDITGTDNHNANLGVIASPDVNTMILEDPKSKPPDPSGGDVET
ncbi:uncharacterized protein A4U43_C04F17650 [Asparagus officinalis]|uniref:Uncharacterized protein n=1 Tax=Asparagus officinalis TaxID=4686 RepID=A0A5P1F1P5_ASPOF|nr:uncharacterized protein A4U43_C04F17650 [Asparagus officinalis]